jgi:hypothetical protein
MEDTPENRQEHEFRDGCWGCAPFWWNIPLCPICKKKLTEKGYCRNCKKHFDLSKEKTISGISKEDFESYVRVQESGQTNMFDIKVVCDLSGLSREQVLIIMKYYEKLKEEFSSPTAV